MWSEEIMVNYLQAFCNLQMQLI